MNASANRRLETARALIKQRRYDEARPHLEALPDNPTARRWLARLDEIELSRMLRRAPPRSALSSSHIALIAALLVLGALILIYLPKGDALTAQRIGDELKHYSTGALVTAVGLTTHSGENIIEITFYDVSSLIESSQIEWLELYAGAARAIERYRLDPAAVHLIGLADEGAPINRIIARRLPLLDWYQTSRRYDSLWDWLPSAPANARFISSLSTSGVWQSENRFAPGYTPRPVS